MSTPFASRSICVAEVRGNVLDTDSSRMDLVDYRCGLAPIICRATGTFTGLARVVSGLVKNVLIPVLIQYFPIKK